MNNYAILTERLDSYKDEELIQYANENATSLTVQAFKLLKKEIEGRKQLPHNKFMLIENIQENRNQKFINEIYHYIYVRSEKIKTVEDLIDDLRENEISDDVINLVLLQLPEIIEKNIKDSNNESLNGLLWLLIGIAVTITSFSYSQMVAAIGGICQIAYGVSKGFGGGNHYLVLKFKKRLEEFNVNNEIILESKLNKYELEESRVEWFKYYPNNKDKSNKLIFHYFLN